MAARGSLVYFLIDNLNALNRVYHYSMANYVFVLKKGMDACPGGKDESKVWGGMATVVEARRQANVVERGRMPVRVVVAACLSGRNGGRGGKGPACPDVCSLTLTAPCPMLHPLLDEDEVVSPP